MIDVKYEEYKIKDFNKSKDLKKIMNQYLLLSVISGYIIEKYNGLKIEMYHEFLGTKRTIEIVENTFMLVCVCNDYNPKNDNFMQSKSLLILYPYKNGNGKICYMKNKEYRDRCYTIQMDRIVYRDSLPKNKPVHLISTKHQDLICEIINKVGFENSKIKSEDVKSYIKTFDDKYIYYQVNYFYRAKKKSKQFIIDRKENKLLNGILDCKIPNDNLLYE